MSQAILELERCHASSIKVYADRLRSGARWTAGAEGTGPDFSLCAERQEEQLGNIHIQ